MGYDTKRWRLVCYDVREPRRYRRFHKILKGYGTPVQYSVFRCRIDDRQVAELRWRLEEVLDDVDALLIVDLCPSCAGKVISRNHVDGWEEKAATFAVIGSSQAPERVRVRSAAGTQEPADDE